MVRQIIWSYNAQNDRKRIFAYWNVRNQSIVYSRKLNELFNSALLLVAQLPEIGKRIKGHSDKRLLVVRDYLIIYQIFEKEIHVLTIWDSRRNPEDFKKSFK